MAIRRCTYDRLSADSAAIPGAVVDDEWLAEPLLQPLSHRACEDVARAAGGKSDDDTHRPRRIRLRPCDARDGRQRGRARDQMQKISAGKFQLNLPSRHSITSSARASRVGGISRPSALAAVRLIMRSNLVGCSTGMSAGFAPRRILSTKSAARRNWS